MLASGFSFQRKPKPAPGGAVRKCLAGVNLQAAREGVGAKVPDWSHPLNIVGNLSFPQTSRTSPERVRSERTCYFLFSSF